MEIDFGLLKTALLWLASPVGAAAATYWLMEEIKKLRELQPKPKRNVSLALAAALASMAYLVLVGLGYVETPLGWLEWLEAFVAVAGGAIGLSQWWHGHKKL